MSKFIISNRTIEPLMKAERPYEDMSINYTSVLHVDGQWRMWYSAYDHNYVDDNDVYMCYATSPDGVHWERPNLGIVPYHGDTNNNILIDGRKTGGMHGMTVFIDNDAAATERYKMVFTRGEVIDPAGFGWYVYGATSSDGIHWHLMPTPLLQKNSDSQTVCFHDKGVYRLYVRQWTTGVFQGTRIVGYTESTTFEHFPDPVHILAPDAHDPADLQFYNSAATKLREDLYVMFPSGFYTGDQTVRPHMAMSSDGIHFERVSHEIAIALGMPGQFDCRSIYVGPGAVPADTPNAWWFYYAGYDTGHDQSHPYSGGYGRFMLAME